MFAIGKDVEVKGFGKWVDTTLLGKIAGYWNDELYIVQLFSVGVDEEREYGARRRDDGYYFRKQVEWQIVHPHFVRDADPEQSDREYNIGDIVDVDENELWTKLPAMLANRRKGVIVAKTLCTAQFFIDDGEPWLYNIKLETSGEIEEDVLSYRMHPHRLWN